MKNVLRIGGAMLAASISATAIYLIATAIRFGATDLNDALSFAVIVLVVAGAISLLIGLPAHMFFRFIGWNQLWKYVLGGVCIGLFGDNLFGQLLIDGAISGAFGAAAFWSIARYAATPVAEL